MLSSLFPHPLPRHRLLLLPGRCSSRTDRPTNSRGGEEGGPLRLGVSSRLLPSYPRGTFSNIWGHLLASLMAQMVKNLRADAGEAGSIPASGRSPGEENDNPLQDSCPENSMHRRAWEATVHGVARESDTVQQLNSNNKEASLLSHPVRWGMTS